MLYSIVKDPIDTANNLNHDLEIICQWTHQWKMEFNPDPNKQPNQVIFSCKKEHHTHPPIYFNNSIVKHVNEQKHFILRPTFGRENPEGYKNYWYSQTTFQISPIKGT